MTTQKMRPWCKRTSLKRLTMQKTSLHGRQGLAQREWLEIFGDTTDPKSSFLKMANLPNVSLETICLHPPDPCMADAHGIGSACAEYQMAFIESRLWRNASRVKEQHAAGTSPKVCFCLSVA